MSPEATPFLFLPTRNLALRYLREGDSGVSLYNKFVNFMDAVAFGHVAVEDSLLLSRPLNPSPVSAPFTTFDAPANTIMRSTGSFSADGWGVGAVIGVEGSPTNDSTYTTIAVSGDTLTTGEPLLGISETALNVVVSQLLLPPGRVHIIGSPATDSWILKETQINFFYYADFFIRPRKGMTAYDKANGVYLLFDGTVWLRPDSLPDVTGPPTQAEHNELRAAIRKFGFATT